MTDVLDPLLLIIIFMDHLYLIDCCRCKMSHSRYSFALINNCLLSLSVYDIILHRDKYNTQVTSYVNKIVGLRNAKLGIV